MTQLRTGAPAPIPPLPVLPLRSGVLYPGTSMTLNVGRPKSLALLRSLHVGDIVAVVPQRDPRLLDPRFADLHPFGTFARVVQIARESDRAYRLTLEGLDRMRFTELAAETDPFWRGSGTPIAETVSNELEAKLLAEALTSRVQELSKSSGAALDEVTQGALTPGAMADRVAAALVFDTADAVQLLATGDAVERLKLVIERLAKAQTESELRSKIDRDVRERFGKHQREAVLREQLRAIRRELGEDEEAGQDELRRQLDSLELPADVRQAVDRELKRLDTSAGQGPEANVIRTYLEWIAALPWGKRAEVTADLGAMTAKLESDHAGLADVKKRILEHMAVQKLSGNPRGTILCFVGPPGVGKTSLGQSIADATGRPFVRVALGGVRDEAEVRGHRRTYVGALPGRIIHGLRKAGVKNPVLLLDEIDKLGNGWAGSPEAALLEVLDPEQNKSFTDHYLELPFDLSEVMFVCTANTLETLSAPLRDRLEIVELSGYTSLEKLEIARRHLIPKRLRESGVPEGALTLTNAAVSAIMNDYTREAGVRQLDREITRLSRSVALEVARGGSDTNDQVIDAPDVARYLGKPRFYSEVAERLSVAGVATGLAWTPVGGDILFIETSRMPGKGRIEITGKLGDVMKESARAALTYVRSHAADLGIEPNALDSTDLHIHVPAGAVPKDGPSAGVTIFTALASLLTDRRVRSDTAMTGECTLRGRVLPVGGIKAKVLAAHRAGLRRVLLPMKNERDLDEVPDSVKQELEFVLVSDMSEVLKAALEPIAGDASATTGSAWSGADAVPPHLSGIA
jgi:ATP-dependent Lon protease